MGPDIGIDLVAREHGNGGYWAIQCKFYDPTLSLQKANIDSFFTASGKRFETADDERGFSQRLIVASTNNWSKHAEHALENQAIPTTRLWLKDLANSPVDWGQFSLANVEDMRLTNKKALRPHQAQAVANAIKDFKASDRGQFIIACGTGKTLAALRLTEQLTAANGQVLFLTPSIALVAQARA
ncbi:MAG: DEAD/DEAH box helicase family protein [Herbaspirillum sp.]|nr:DEAD/DEAH box helicase family protein [Herbaspirillum sp.]